MGQRAMKAQVSTLEVVIDAIIVPPPALMRDKRQLHLAVLDSAANVLPAGVCGTNRLTSAGYKPDPTLLVDPKRLTGTWLYGGLASHHFGHQITRSLGRLAGLPDAGAIDGILFAPLDRRARDPVRLKLLRRLLDGLGVTVPFLVATSTTQVDRLLIGPDLFSENTLCHSDPAYVDWVRNCILPDTKPIPGSKLYVTRTQLDPKLGRLLNEDVLEQNLARQGFEIYVPEVHPLPDQISTYAAAETIVTTDGSHGHVIAFARQSNQRIITIARRFEAPKLLLNHLESFGLGLSKSEHHYVTCLSREWWPRLRADNLSLGECDFDALFDTLARLGVLPQSAKTDWQRPDQNQIDASKSLGLEPNDRLLTTLERAEFLSELRRARNTKPVLPPTETEKGAEQPMVKAVEPEQAPAAIVDKKADGLRYFRVLKGLHQRLRPDWYLEIGTFTGLSLRFVESNYVAIDPGFQLHQIPPLKGREMIFFQDTSDAFFESITAQNLAGKIDFAFLDGLHHYEALLRDFMNVEPLMAPGGMVVLHDCLPYTVPMADRVQPPNTEWTGDVWKTLLILMQTRPDLQIDVLDAAPTGLVVIRKLNAAKGKKLKSSYKALIKSWDPVTFDTYPGGLPAFWDKLTVIPAGQFLDSLPQR